MPSALVTCGPSFEPIDAVRRLTNHSTGELGAMLCEALAEAGFSVTCLRGVLATHPAPAGVRVLPFQTNRSLLEILQAETPPDAVFHAAALCDFTAGPPPAGKVRSDIAEWKLTLRPAAKVLPELRSLFPRALIVGWKYEVDGDRRTAVALGHSQITRNRTDACVVNGPAYGEGLGLVDADGIAHCPTRAELCRRLVHWTQSRLTAR